MRLLPPVDALEFGGLALRDLDGGIVPLGSDVQVHHVDKLVGGGRELLESDLGASGG